MICLDRNSDASKQVVRSVACESKVKEYCFSSYIRTAVDTDLMRAFAVLDFIAFSNRTRTFISCDRWEPNLKIAVKHDRLEYVRVN